MGQSSDVFEAIAWTMNVSRPADHQAERGSASFTCPSILLALGIRFRIIGNITYLDIMVGNPSQNLIPIPLNDER